MVLRTRTRPVKNGQYTEYMQSTSGFFPNYDPTEVKVRSFGTYPMSYESITDHNNGASRPQSPCSHSRAIVSLEPVARWNPSPSLTYWGGVPSLSPKAFHDFCRVLVMERAGEDILRLKKRAYDEFAAFNKRFSSINFFTELADVGSLFKDIRKYQYIDAEFGILPMIADINTAIESLATTSEHINAKLADLGKPKKLSFTKVYEIKVPETAFALSQDFRPTSGSITAKVRFKGEFRAFMPVLMSRELILDYIKLDREGFHPDVATLWEAIPFSWLIDWFYPVGNALEALSGSWFNPQAHITGTLSIKAKGNTEFNVFFTNGDKRRVSYGCNAFFSLYSREGIGFSYDSRSISKPEIRLPVPDMRKASLLNDIWGAGSSFEAGKKLSRKAKGKLKRASRWAFGDIF